MKYNKKGESRIEISDILDYFKDINSMYNDCSRYDSLKRMLEDLVAETRENVELERKTGKWIPCSKRLPEVEERILVTDDSGGARTVDTDRLGQYEWSHDNFWYYSQNVVAWMPFPEPYEGEK